jgi:hypothetical protein
LARNYRPALLSYLGHQNEESLHRAYELGRLALADGVSLLDVVRAHHNAFSSLLSTVPAKDVTETVDVATAFLIEALAPFEIARRGFLDNRPDRH